ncbi:MAG: hydroxymethylbilane synthase [Proteobacteria bacterium]|nr:hydroxymethylbilane synthase [Pseudomonadota bacterium]
MPQSNSRILRLGTRGSKLALVQAEMVRSGLAAKGFSRVEIIVLKTSGDRIQDRSLADSGGKGLFTKELEEALLHERIDLAVHSMKDVPVAIPAGLSISALLPREDPRDAFISNKAKSLAELPKGAVFGTSSVRRHAQVARARPDLQIKLLRGNVDTRLAKLDADEYDGMLLAVAGLKRLGLEARITSRLDTKDWPPALAQGAVGIEIRESDTHAREITSQLNDMPTEVALNCERAFQFALDGSCRTSIGGLATFENNVLRFRGEVLAPDGSDFAETSLEQNLGHDPRNHAQQLGRELGEALKPRVKQWLAI